MNKPCLNCGTPTPNTRCNNCNKDPRPSAHKRGYNTAHKQGRQALAALLPTPCGYGCGTILTQQTRWVAAHIIDGDPNAGWIPACRKCNENAKRKTDKRPHKL